LLPSCASITRKVAAWLSSLFYCTMPSGLYREVHPLPVLRSHNIIVFRWQSAIGHANPATGPGCLCVAYQIRCSSTGPALYSVLQNIFLQKASSPLQDAQTTKPAICTTLLRPAQRHVPLRSSGRLWLSPLHFYALIQD